MAAGPAAREDLRPALAGHVTASPAHLPAPPTCRPLLPGGAELPQSRETRSRRRYICPREALGGRPKLPADAVLLVEGRLRFTWEN